MPGASPYTPYNQYTYTMVDERKSRYREMRAEAGSFIQARFYTTFHTKFQQQVQQQKSLLSPIAGRSKLRLLRGEHLLRPSGLEHCGRHCRLVAKSAPLSR